MGDAATLTATAATTTSSLSTKDSGSQRNRPPPPLDRPHGTAQIAVQTAGGILSRGLSFLRASTPASSSPESPSASSSPTEQGSSSSMPIYSPNPFPSIESSRSAPSCGAGEEGSSSGDSSNEQSNGANVNMSSPSNSYLGPRAMSLATTHKNRKRKGSLRKVILNRGALRERRESKSGLSIDIKQSLALGLAHTPNVMSSAGKGKAATTSEEDTNPESPDRQQQILGRCSPFSPEDGDSNFGLGIAAQGKAGTGAGSISERDGPGGSGTVMGGGNGLRLAPLGSMAATHVSSSNNSNIINPLTSGTNGGGGLLSPGIIDSTTDEDEPPPLQLRPRHHGKSPLSFSSPSPGRPPVDWDYAETEWWGWVVLLATWFVFITGTGSCFGVWTWAWDVGKTPYAPPELEDDPTLPIVGYYPALMILSGIMAWLWVLVAWVGMKYFRHAKVTGD